VETTVVSLLFNPFLIPIVAIIGYFAYRIIDSIAVAHRESSKHRQDTELKMVLAQRGMSAEEILRVVNADVSDQRRDSASASYPGDYQQAGYQPPGGAMPPRKRPGTPLAETTAGYSPRN
jgi:hypothetical protein